MNSVAMPGRLLADPVTEHLGDFGVCELRLAGEWDGSPARTSEFTVTFVTRRTFLTAARLSAGDYVSVTGWLRAQSIERHGRVDQRVDVVADRVDVVGSDREPPEMPADAHLEAAYEDRHELDEAN
jgi:single-stranded DNA-binding protein